MTKLNQKFSPKHFLYASFHADDFRRLPYVDFEITLQFSVERAAVIPGRRTRSAGIQVHGQAPQFRAARSQTRINQVC